MTADNWIAVAFLVYVGFLLFGAPWLAQKQANQTLAKWAREDAEADRKSSS
ncbi:hypothetical protein pEaSNUABM5_00117 [Erwinia phage pEa_SNUABM_5]|uniref:Uncharacterized protein n=1 Tax=Erwinia phage pEa_SNUABM_5 TaxID=2797313 RepID=A0A7T8IW57_9CAUD|nr:hypothetical protein MPK73_gp117 [Erwinia phage pEa_SNUABM_5]QQO90259.1 hypothetical protein pEaSNUABM5_00117 [Erwinia phage pEa_SNUABM_5]